MKAGSSSPEVVEPPDHRPAFGLMFSGIISLSLGAVILSPGYQLFKAWLAHAYNFTIWEGHRL